MPEETLKEKTAKGLFWGGLSNGVQQLLGLVFGVVLARLLNAEDYGTVGVLAIFSAIASTIQESGFTAALTNKTVVKHEDYNAVFWFSLLVSTTLYVVLFVLAPLIAWFYHKPELITLSRFLFIGFWFVGLAVAQNAYLFKNLMVKERAKIDIIALAISGVVGVCAVLLGLGYWGLAIQSVLYSVAGAIMRWYYSGWKPSFEINFHPLKDMIGFSFKLFLTNIFNQVNNNIFSVVLGRYYGAREVGFYSQGQKWMVMGHSFIGGMINGVAQPILVQVVNDKGRQCAIFRKMLRFGAFVSFPLILGLAFVGEEFVVIMVGEKWLPAVPFLQMFCIWGAVGYIWTLYTNLLMTHGKSDIYMAGMIGTGLSQLAVIYLMYPWGIYMMVAAYILVYFVMFFIWNLFAYRLIGIKMSMVFKDVSPFLFVVLFSFSIAWLLTKDVENVYLLFFFKILISAVIYLLTMRLCGAVVYKESLSFLKTKVFSSKIM
ncbi:lipopolysaccharide biosynthesis protein [Parabacteroides gordonii]|jgi:O-antigen/teichoic acid export membrane protein|uniref:lipopolysaccharide biosynthesis protein n=1 Tax=Parabacteroides gordonii TaxID=574930 RepID=UPI00241C6FFF|nr:lipopolysaccharide biosynthesis protein [Parabacteroides gordonii]